MTNLPATTWHRPPNVLTLPDDRRAEFLNKRVALLFAQFKPSNTIDARVYSAAVVAVLRNYPDSVVVSVTHPVSGLASRQNWLPTVHELRNACDAASYSPSERASRAEAETLARREQYREDSFETRAEHVARLRAEGKLRFDAIVREAAQNTLDRLEREATENFAHDEV